ncbi:MAG: adenosylhomocysteinase [Eubacteriales bacterium]|nr:adenosylhomocysteinase [Eubacteriales bacterium]MDD4462162.1 adenosylhomocysteinase [Eubacteriales bacterium]
MTDKNTSTYDVRDIGLAPSGRRKIAWAWEHMPVLRRITADMKRDQPLRGLKVAISVHVEAKTACLAKALAEAGAEVALTGCNPLSTQDDVAAALAADGLHVYCVHGADQETYWRHLRQALSFEPDLVVDDGGDFAQIMHTELPELASRLIGGSEETTTGVHRLQILAQSDRLRYPVIAVNDARCKHLFDNRYGTGQSVWTAIMSLTNLLVAGKTVVVAGFGMCGKGVALRARGLGARVIVTEIDPVKACEALMEGYDVLPMAEAAPLGDLFVTVTGCCDVIDQRFFPFLRDGAILCNAGHFDVEINLHQLESLADSVENVRDGITAYVMPDQRRIHVLAEGRLVNLAGGDGHPAEIMDMSFSLQALSVLYLAEHGRSLKPDVYQLPSDIDDAVARRLLEHLGRGYDQLTPEQADYIDNWDL